MLLVYAVLGNYVALPGYIRFLERGGTSAAGSTFDLSVLFGAARTILWMYSFQLGVLAIAIAHSIRDGLHTKYLAVGAVVWLPLWSWPSLPAPGPWFYILFGGMTLCGIALQLLQRHQPLDGKLNRTLFLGAIVFFAFATWEVCGLGSTGRILHPEQSARPLAHNIVVTQSSKLMFEFLLAWGLLLASTSVGRRRTADLGSSTSQNCAQRST
jgi:hypothetical protein